MVSLACATDIRTIVHEPGWAKAMSCGLPMLTVLSLSNKYREMRGRFEQPLQYIQVKAFVDAMNELEDLVFQGRHYCKEIAMNKVSNVQK
jgi:hypothetical protein